MKHVLRRWLRRYFSDPQVLILILILVAGFVVFSLFSRMLAPVLVAVVLSVLLDSLITWLMRFNVRRETLVYLVFLLFVFVFVDLLLIVLPLVWRQVSELIRDLPGMVSTIKATVSTLPQKYPGVITEETVDRALAILSEEIEGIGGGIVKLSVVSAKGVVEIVVYLVLVPFLVFFMLKDKKLILDWLSGFIPEERGLAVLVWDEVYDQFFNYLRGKVLEIMFVWAINYAAFAALGLKYSVILSMLVGLAVLVPYIGAAVMFVPVVLVAFFQWGLGAHTTWTVIAYLALHALDGNLVAPLLLSRVVRIHPVAIIVAILVCGGLWGFWGLVFAIPLATLMHAVLRAWKGTAEATAEQA
ncbi:MAG TPA: AI-2E family transporter [Deltaproteobacteria bacterium]|nr:AI-2E family transporter [Deltaproteobacteria bacterium]HOM29254.1 AI-2E family transporter [Deltaproteobacteria bacterium]HPP80300.1 AI-2E family transporter [Deltaproteobacteria bacterium]